MSIKLAQPLQMHYHVGKNCKSNKPHKIQCYDNIESSSSKGSVNNTLTEKMDRTVRCTWIYEIAYCVICENSLQRTSRWGSSSKPTYFPMEMKEYAYSRPDFMNTIKGDN